MPRFAIAFVRGIDRLNYGIGRMAMYLLFVLMAVLMWSSISKIAFMPSLWTLEVAQFVMVSYYVLGGPYAMQMDAHVRMDLFYAKQTPVRRAWWDGITVFALFIYLAILIWGAAESFGFSLGLKWGDGLLPDIGRLERSRSAWRPYMWPIKLVMLTGFVLMFLQALAIFIRDIATIRGEKILMPQDMIALLMFSTMLLLMMTGQRVFGIIGFVAVVASTLLWGTGGHTMGFSASIKLMSWYPLLSLPMFVFMGYVMSEARLADDLYRMFHVWFGRIPGGLAIGTILLMVLISAMNGLSVAGMAIGSTIALPELLRRGYDKRMVTGVIQAGSSLGILIPPSVVLVLYAMIARAPVSELWLAGIVPGLLMAAMFVAYIAIRCTLQPHLGPALDAEERARITMADRLASLRAGLLPLAIFGSMMVPFIYGFTSLVESSVIGVLTTVAGAMLKRSFNRDVFEVATRNTLGISCMFMWVILAALAFGAVFDGLGAVKAVESLFTEQLGLGPWTILILMQVSFLLMGMFLDDTAMLVIVAPLYVPLVAALDLGIPPRDVLVWYGVLYTITCQIAYLTPPFGYNLFLMRAFAPKEISMGDIYTSVTPFVMVMIAALALIMVFPDLALWLPNKFYPD